MAQVHKKHRFISLCLADNGIGIANSLKTGPQFESLRKKFNLDRLQPEEEEKILLKTSLEKDISGAYDAKSQIYGYFFKNIDRGQVRGMGFSRILNAAKKLKIRFFILSNKALLEYDPDGKLIREEGFNEKIFVGTMFNLIIPIKEKEENI